MSSILTVSNDLLCVLPIRLDQFVFERLLDLPEDVAVSHVLEYQLALFSAS